MLNLFYSLFDSSSAPEQPGGFAGFISKWGLIIFFAVILVVMVVVSGRQRKKQEQAMNEKLNSLKVGDKIETIGRIFGTIVDIDEEENTIVLLTGNDLYPGYVKVDKMAVYRTIVDYVEDNPVEEVHEEADDFTKTETAADDVNANDENN